MKSPLLSLLAVAAVSLPALLAQTPGTAPDAPKTPLVPASPDSRIRPTIPLADRHEPGRVFIEHADILEKPHGSDAQILIGNVQFRKGDMFMYCDSARFYEETSTLEAYKNVRMEQGDTLFVYSDELYYDGITEVAELRAYVGRDVRLINRDVTLTTPVCFYDMAEDVGYYMTGGTLRDTVNTLESMQGYFYPATKDAFFYLNVELTGPSQNDTLKMYTDSLAYNTGTSVARLMCETLIVSKDGEIHSTSGLYDTRTGVADLYDRSIVHTRRGNTLTGDTLFYDRNAGFGEAFGNMVLTDSANSSCISGDYGYYNDLIDSAFVTGNALAKEYSRKDTLYLHGDTITASQFPDSTKITNVFHRVRFFRNDIQGLCDSMSVVERDSVLYMYYNPIVWSGDKQVTGNLIWVHLNDSTADWARLPEIGLMSQHVGEDCYNQLSASDMTVWMEDSTVRRLYAEGNVQTIMFPMENDSTYNKFSYTESSYMNVDFTDEGEIDRLVMWPETTGKVTPLYLARRTAYYLPKFRWYGSLRPMEPMEVFDYPEEMAYLARQNILGTMSKDAFTMRAQALGKPASIPKGAMIPGLNLSAEEDTGLPEEEAVVAEETDAALPPDEPEESFDDSENPDDSDDPESSDSPEEIPENTPEDPQP